MRRITMNRQTADNECGFCCIAMVASYFKFFVSIGELREAFPIGRDGLSAVDLVRIMNSFGLDVTPLKINDFETEYLAPGVYIAHLKNNHFVVLQCKGKSDPVVFDPQNGKFKMPLSDLSKVSSGIFLSVKKATDFIPKGKRLSDFRHLYSTIKKVSGLMTIVTLVSLLSYLISLVVPISMQRIIDMILGGTELQIIPVITYMICFIGATILVMWFRNRETIILQKKLLNIVSLDTVKHLFNIKYSFFDSRHQGDIIFRLNLLNQFQSLVSNSFIQCSIGITCVIVISCYLLVVYGFIGLLVIAYMTCIAFISFFLGLRLSELKQAEYSSRKELESALVEVVSSMLQIRMLHLDDFFLSNYTTSFNKYITTFCKTERRLQNYNMILSTLFTYSPAVITLTLFVFTDSSSIGQLFALFSILTTFSNQILSFVMQVTSFIMIKSSMYLVNDLLDEKEMKEQGDTQITDFSSLKIDNLKFKYGTKAAWALNGINLDLKKGESIAIVGRSGSGKTTLVKLLSKLYFDFEGEILLNNNNLLNISNKSLSLLVGVVPQLPVYFNMTIRDNITLGDKSISTEAITRALKTVNFWDEVIQMPMQLETVVSGQGGNLSGGQIQKLSIARAIVRSPQLLILDEATSSMDPQNEKIVYNNLKAENISTVIVSHRLSTIQNASKILVLDHGDIIEAGNHMSLMAQKGLYYELFINQMA